MQSPFRPRSFAAPPPDPAEALYYEGMAAYQHRNWEEALERFSRLKGLQPTRPGLDALLDEVRWFLQLQEAAPLSGRGAEPAAAEVASESTVGPVSRPRWQTWGLPMLAVIGLAALVLIALQGQMPWTNASDREAQELFNRGQARLAVGDYEGAQAAFQKLLEIAPDDPEALLGLNRAQRQQALAQDYTEAEAAIAEEDWDRAAAALEKVQAIDSNYADVQAKADLVAQRRRLTVLYNDGSRLYDLGQWEDAIAQFERIREMDGTYRAEAVAEFLFVCYLNAGQGLIEQTNSDIAPIQRAIEYFSSALAIHPRNQPAADARRLGSLYLEAVRALASEDLPEAQTRLEALLLEAPTYANGRAAQRLYSLLIKRAEVALRDGNILAAIRFYQQAQTVAVADHSTAMAGEKYARAITPTPTPSPTRTPRPTLLPVTPTPYAVVRTGVLNLRAGPGTSYPVLGQARTADALAITGRNTDGSWLQVCCVSARMGAESSGGELRGRTGWVAAGLVEVQGDLAFLAVIALPPLPTSTPQPPTASRHLCMSGRVRDAAGNPLAGWTIVLQPPVGSSQTQRTDNNGIYQFNDLAAGTYMISELLESGWRAISPQSSTVEVVPADICLAVDFWNERLEKSAAPARPTEVPTLASPTPPR